MTHEEFCSLPEWELLVKRMVEMVNECVESALSCDNFGEVRYNAGFRDALRSVLKLPSQLLKANAPNQPDQKESVLELVNHPRTSRNVGV